MGAGSRAALALSAGLACSLPVALWLLARRRPKRRDAIVDAYKQHIQALVARLRNLIAADEPPTPPPQTPPQTPRKEQRDPEEAYAFSYRLDLQGDNITLAAEAVAWVQCRRAVADACASHHLKEITCGTIVYDGTIAATSAAPCVARFLHGLASVDNVEILVKALAAARAHVDAQRPRRSLVATLAKGEEVFDVALAKDAKVAFDDVSIFLSAKKKKIGYVLCRVESGPRLVLRGLHVDEKRRGEGLATLLVRLWLAVAEELGCGVTTQAIDKPVVAMILEAAGLEPRSSKFEVKVARDAQNRTVVWSHSTDARSLFSRRFESSQGFRVKPDGEMSPKRNVRRAHVRTTFSLPDDGAPEPLRGISWRAARLVAFANGVPALRRRLRAGEGVASPPRSIR